MSLGSTIWYPVARIIRDFLVEGVIGFPYDPITDWSIATATTPKLPVNCITLRDEAAQKVARTIASGVIERPVVSIEIRSKQHEPGQYKAKEILEELDGLGTWSWEGDSDEYGQTVVIKSAHRVRGIFYLGYDENGRHLFNLEYAFVIQSIED